MVFATERGVGSSLWCYNVITVIDPSRLPVASGFYRNAIGNEPNKHIDRSRQTCHLVSLALRTGKSFHFSLQEMSPSSSF